METYYFTDKANRTASEKQAYRDILAAHLDDLNARELDAYATRIARRYHLTDAETYSLKQFAQYAAHEL